MDGNTTTERIDTVVIGAGQTGLSAGYHLQKHGVPFTILDSDARVGDHWRRAWDSMRLYSPARSDGLPGMPFPAAAYHYPSGREMGDFLETYARRFALPVESGVTVDEVVPAAGGDGGFIVRAGERRIHARRVIVASGPFRRPHVPDFAADTRSGHPPAALERVPQPVTAPGRPAARGRGQPFRCGYRLRGGTDASDDVVGAFARGVAGARHRLMAGSHSSGRC